jgi:IS30 family transposase
MVTEMAMISQRPAEAADRAVPGHREGDLIMGAFNRSAIGTLGRADHPVRDAVTPTRRARPSAVRDALVAKIATLPQQLRRSLTWNQGSEMHLHGQFTQAAGMPVYFCNPHAPWQRGSSVATIARNRPPQGPGPELASFRQLRVKPNCDPGRLGLGFLWASCLT